MSNTQTISEAPEDPGLQRHGHAPQSFWILALGSIGVVYGDIGTSPLYALREAVKAALATDGAITPPLILGILSLIIWALILVVTVKYIFVLAECRQQRRRRNTFAHGPRPAWTRQILYIHPHSRNDWRSTVLW